MKSDGKGGTWTHLDAMTAIRRWKSEDPVIRAHNREIVAHEREIGAHDREIKEMCGIFDLYQTVLLDCDHGLRRGPRSLRFRIINGSPSTIKWTARKIRGRTPRSRSNRTVIAARSSCDHGTLGEIVTHDHVKVIARRLWPSIPPHNHIKRPEISGQNSF